MPKISIIVPVYKVEKYLSECIDSIIDQTFKDIEIILVDDGSPDNCGKICDEYAKKDSRIVVIHQKNGGLSNARNTGIKHAKSKYIAFVDSDDFISNEYCEVLLAMLDNTDYDFAVCGTHRFTDGNFVIPGESESDVRIIDNIKFLSMQIHKESEFGVWNKLYKRKIFDSLSFADGKLNEDVIFSADLAANLKNGVICTNKKMYYYRQREGSIVSAQSIKGSIHFIHAGNHLIEQSAKFYPQLYNDCVEYTVNYPWMFVDRILVNRQIKDNKDFLVQLQSLIRSNIKVISESENISHILKHRMMLFSRSIRFYYINMYTRLLRVYLYKIIKKDPYKDGHGI